MSMKDTGEATAQRRITGERLGGIARDGLFVVAGAKKGGG